MTKIEKTIVAYSIADPAAQPQVEREAMHEGIARPEALRGRTYKIKTPLTEHAMYVTINDFVLSEGTEHEQRHPFEIFINCKDMENFAWVTALTRVMSAVFRKGGDVSFLIAELKSVFDPKGGYFKRGGKYMPSTIAEIGDVIERHLMDTGLIKAATGAPVPLKTATPDEAVSEFPDHAEVCPKCQYKALVKLDGCLTCLSCGDGKCG